MNLSWVTQNYLTRGFWGDEAWTAGISRLPVSEILRITGEDFHPPVYYFLVHYLGAPFNYAEIPVRLISTFFFLLIPITAYFLTRALWQTKKGAKNGNRTAPLVTSLLVLLSPILFTYAFEARSYALLAFQSVLSAFIFWWAKDEVRGQFKWRILYTVIGGIMIYTHYYAWFILASHAVYLILFDRRRLLHMLTSALGVLAIQLPWLPTLLGQTSSVKGSYWIGPINSQTHWEFFYRVTGGDIQSIFQKPLAYVIGGLVLVGLFAGMRRLSRAHAFLLCWVIVPTLIPTLISLTVMPVFFYRYLIFSSIPLLILTVQTIKRWPPQIYWSAILIIAAMQLFVVSKIFVQYPRSMREAVGSMYTQKTPLTDPVYTTLPAFAEVLYYIGDQDQVIVTPEGLVQFSGKSLLDAYVRNGVVLIEEAPISSPYWLLTPGKQAVFTKPL